MGGLLSKYAGSNDIERFGTRVVDESDGEQPKPRQYDYVILGGGSVLVIAGALADRFQVEQLAVF
jgi:hypothetical protein